MDRILEKKKFSKGKFTVYVVFTAIAVFLLFSFFKNKGVSHLNVEAERITIEMVTKGRFREFIPVTGTVMPVKTVYLDAIEGGTVEEIFVEDGKEVRKGDPILRLSNPQLHMEAIAKESQLLDQQNNLRTTKINLDQQTIRLKDELLQVDYQLNQAKRLYENNKILVKDQLIPKIEFEQSEEEYQYLLGKKNLIIKNLKNDSIFRTTQDVQIISSLNLIHKNLDFLHTNLQNLVLRAPMSGQLSSLKAELGETKSRGENIAQIDNTEDFKIRAKIGEHYVSRVFLEQEAEFKFGGKSYWLVIRKIFPDVKNGEFEVDMAFKDEKPAGIKRGQSLQIKLALGDETEAILLPRGGFYQETGGGWAYVIQSGTGRAYKKDIRLGRQNPEYYEVLEGLQPGQQVITSKYEQFNGAEELVIE